MKLIYPLTFKMHEYVLNSHEEYIFGDVTGSIYIYKGKISAYKKENRVEYSPNPLVDEPYGVSKSSLLKWIKSGRL